MPRRGGSSRHEPRYLGCRGADLLRPYAAYIRPATLPPQQHVVDACWGLPTPASSIPDLDDLAKDLHGEVGRGVENGYGRRGRIAWAAALTDMPGVSAAMWDWWFGWHSTESARYRLWHPDAHAFAAIREDRSTEPGLTDRERYVGNTSYVDEYVGGQLQQIAIEFLDPAGAGLRTSRETTVVYARVGSTVLPLTLGYLAHQVSPTPSGAVMRSRFYLNVPGFRRVDGAAARAALRRGSVPALVQRLPLDLAFARGLLEHCGREMHHLASFLPRLHADTAAH